MDPPKTSLTYVKVKPFVAFIRSVTNKLRNSVVERVSNKDALISHMLRYRCLFLSSAACSHQSQEQFNVDEKQNTIDCQ